MGDGAEELAGWCPISVYQDFSANAARKLSSSLEYIRELLDNSLAPGPVRNAPPGGGPLRVEVSLSEQPIDAGTTYRVLTYRENGASVGLGSLDNLVNYGHKKTVQVHAQGQASPGTTTSAAGSSDELKPPSRLSIYGEIGQGLPMTVNALSARAYLFFNRGGQTYVVTYGQAVHDKHGAMCRAVLVLPQREPAETKDLDLCYAIEEEKNPSYAAHVMKNLGHFVRDHWRENLHGHTKPAFANIKELMERARQVSSPGLLYDFVLMKDTCLKSALNPRTHALDIEDTEGSSCFLSEAVQHWYLPGQREGCELGGCIQPPRPEEDVVLTVQGQVVDRFAVEPWVKQLQASGTSKTQVLTMIHPDLGEIKIQILLWPRNAAGTSADAGDDEDAVDDAAVGGIRLFQSSDRAIWTGRGQVPHCLDQARCSLSWHVAVTGGKSADDHKHFLAMCGLRDSAAAAAAGLPTKQEFADVKGTREKVVKWWLTLNNMMCYVMLDRAQLHRLGLLKETKDDLVDKKLTRELFYIIYRGIAKRIWEERDKIRAAAAPAPTPAPALAPAPAPASAPAAVAAAAPRESHQDGQREHRAPSAAAAAAGPARHARPGRSPPAGPPGGPCTEALRLGSTPVCESAYRKRKAPERFSFVTPQRTAPPKAAATRLKARKRRAAGAGDGAGASGSAAGAEHVLGLLDSVMETAFQLKQGISGKHEAAAQRSHFLQLERAEELAKLAAEVLDLLQGPA